MDAKPLTPYEDRAGDTSRDFAGARAFSLHHLTRMVQDCYEQPLWRSRAALCGRYYNGKQLDALRKQALRDEGLDERIINLIRPVINSVLGQEAKSRTDVRIEADGDDFADVSEVISSKLKEAERETLAHMAVSDGYASMVKMGLGWVHVSRNSDPLAYPYRVESVPLDEIWWDYRGQRGATLTDACRWLVRERMVDLDEIESAMPEFKEVLRRSISGWPNEDHDATYLGRPDDISLREALGAETRFNMVVNKATWADSSRNMVKVYEVWYRVPAVVAVLHIGPTKRVQYDEKDPKHVEMVARGLVKVSKGVTSQVRRAMFAGPHRLLDEGTKRRNFPYTPFFCFRDTEDKSPYGMIDGMIAPQDDFTDRRHRIQWMLKSRQIQMDNDALDPAYNTIADIADQIMRPDLSIITNPNRTNRNQSAVRIENTLNMQPEQFNVMNEAKQEIQDVAGRYASQLGSRPAGVTSGIANSILVEQGEQAMGEMNDNYVYARRCVFENLVHEIVEDHKGDRMAVAIGTGKTRRMVYLNDWNPETNQSANTVADAEVRTALADTPNTPAFRQQTQQQLATIIQAIGQNPQALAILAPAYIEASNMPARQQIADDLRKSSGLPLSGDKEGQAQAEQQQIQAQQQAQQAAQAMATAQLDVQTSTSERNRAAARQHAANAALIESRLQAGIAPAEVGEIQARTENLMSQAANDDDLISQALAEAEAA